MGQDPDAIRHEVEHTREQMGETIDALGHKADVKGRAKERVGELRHGARRAAGTAQENPMGLAVGAVAAGFLAGMLIPSSRVEDEKLGPVADEVRQQAKEAGGQLADSARQTAGSIAR